MKNEGKKPSTFALHIMMDEERMRKDGYDVEKVNNFLDDLFVDRLKLKKNIKDCMYEGYGKEAWSSVWAGIDICKEYDWFREYVKEWEYLTNAFTNDPEVFECENLIHEYREMGVM